MGEMNKNTRYKNANWRIETASYEGATLAVLMDIRDELQKLNSLLHCQKVLKIPETLNAISRNTSKKNKKEAK